MTIKTCHLKYSPPSLPPPPPSFRPLLTCLLRHWYAVERLDQDAKGNGRLYWMLFLVPALDPFLPSLLLPLPHLTRFSSPVWSSSNPHPRPTGLLVSTRRATEDRRKCGCRDKPR